MLATCNGYMLAYNYHTQRTEKRYAERRMEQESSTFVRIFNWEEDKFLLIYPQKVENWEICHSGYDEVHM